jgi:tRNA (cmo5U34)-methyltransferase
VTVDWRDPTLAEEWDRRGPELPTRAEQLEIALAMLEVEEIGERWILDLGAGSGLVAEQVLERLPEARLLCADLSDHMLALARDRLGRFGDRFELARVDLEGAEAELPDRDYAAAIAVQALHNLSPVNQLRTLRLLSTALGEDALFVLVDKILVPEAAYSLFAPVWGRLERLSGSRAHPIAYAEYLAELAQQGDKPVPLERQLQWLREANFEPAVLHVHGDRAVIGSRRLRR